MQQGRKISVESDIYVGILQCLTQKLFYSSHSIWKMCLLERHGNKEKGRDGEPQWESLPLAVLSLCSCSHYQGQELELTPGLPCRWQEHLQGASRRTNTCCLLGRLPWAGSWDQETEQGFKPSTSQSVVPEGTAQASPRTPLPSLQSPKQERNGSHLLNDFIDLSRLQREMGRERELFQLWVYSPNSPWWQGLGQAKPEAIAVSSLP